MYNHQIITKVFRAYLNMLPSLIKMIDSLWRISRLEGQLNYQDLALLMKFTFQHN